MKSINDEEERKKDEETNKHAIHPPATSKSSKNKSMKARQRKNNGDQELNVNNTQKSANKLDFATCANIIERVINSFPFMKSLQLNEIEVLIFIFSIFGNLVSTFVLAPVRFFILFSPHQNHTKIIQVHIW